MGELLDTPIKQMEGEDDDNNKKYDKRFRGDNDALKYGVRSIQGRRKTMEDTYLCELDIPCPRNQEDIELKINHDYIPKAHIFGVFDGHGGIEIAQYVKDNFVKFLLQTDEFKREKYEDALKKAFEAIDQSLKDNSPETVEQLKKIPIENDLSAKEQEELEVFKSILNPRKLENCNISMFTGTTACVCLIIENTIYIANAGDSRCVIVSENTIKMQTKDHRLVDPDEKKRIEVDDGFIDNSYSRLNGVLSLSRSIGDLEYKKKEWHKPEDQIITCKPDIYKKKISEVDYILLGTDGVWEFFKDEKEIINYIQDSKIFNETDDGESTLAQSLKTLFEKLFEIKGLNNTKIGLDNMTMIAIKLKQKYKSKDKEFDNSQKKRAEKRKIKREDNKKKPKKEEQVNAVNLQNVQGGQLNKVKEKEIEENKNEEEENNTIKKEEINSIKLAKEDNNNKEDEEVKIVNDNDIFIVDKPKKDIKKESNLKEIQPVENPKEDDSKPKEEVTKEEKKDK